MEQLGLPDPIFAARGHAELLADRPGSNDILCNDLRDFSQSHRVFNQHTS
jgi:hypothetical protein